QGVRNGTQSGAQLACDGVSVCYARAVDSGTATGQLFKSTDAGATWSSLNRVASVLAVSNTSIVYVTSGQMIARSDDGGATFTLINRPTTTGSTQPDCSGPYAARGDKIFAACPDGVYRSDD